MGIDITNDHSTGLPWFSAIAFRQFGAKVKNIQFAAKVISLFKIGLKLVDILHNLGNKWRILNRLINKEEKNENLDRFLLYNGKNHGKAKKYNEL